MRKFPIALALSLMLAATAFAKTAPKKITSQKVSALGKISVHADPAFDNNAMLEKFANLDVKGYRNLAATTADGDGMSPKLVEMINFMNGLGRDPKNPNEMLPYAQLHVAAEELAKKLVTWESEVDSYPNDAKFFVSQILPLKHFQGFVWRLIPLVETKRALRQSVVDQIQTAFADMKLSFPDTEWQVGFAYITQPLAGLEEKDRFTDEEQIQAFFADDQIGVYSSVKKSIAILDAIGTLKADSKLKWDNRGIYGKLSFGENKGLDSDRYQYLREPERLAALAKSYRQLYMISLSSIYSNNGAAKLAQNAGAMYGVEIGKAEAAGLLDFFRSKNTDVLAPTRKDFVDLMRSAPFRDNFKKSPNAAIHAGNAIENLKKSVFHGYKAWTLLSANEGEAQTVSPLIDPGFFKGKKTEIQKGFQNVAAVLNIDLETGDAKKYNKVERQIASVITGDTLTVNLEHFIKNLPQDSKDLLPLENGFTDNKAYNISVNGKETRNYDRGRAFAWNSKYYGELFPALKGIQDEGERNKAVAKMMRIWTESRGGSFTSDFVQAYVK